MNHTNQLASTVPYGEGKSALFPANNCLDLIILYSIRAIVCAARLTATEMMSV